MNAAMLISEVQNEAKDRGGFLSLATFDAAKAFEVVWQASLLRKSYQEDMADLVMHVLRCSYLCEVGSPHLIVLSD